MNTPPPLPGTKPKLEWYENAWVALPFALIVVGGALGGACGGAAWAINQKVFQKTHHPVLRYVLTGLISVAAVFTYLAVATALYLLLNKQR